MVAIARTERPRKAGDEPEKQAEKASPRKPVKWGRVVVLALLLLLLWLLPAIAAHTPMLGWAINRFSGLNGTAEIDSASLGWFSPISATGVTVKDKHGKTVASLASLDGDRSLIAIACNYTNLGGFRLHSPKLSVVVREDGSNVEDLLARYLEPKKTPAPAKSSGVALRLEVADASMTVVDQTLGHTWQVNKLAASFDLPKDASLPMAVQASLALSGLNPPAKLSAELKYASARGEATLNIEQFPLAILRPLANRLISRGATLTGRLSSNVRASWGGQNSKNGVSGALNLEGFSLAMPAVLGADIVQLDRLNTAVQASWQADRVEIEKASAECDVASAALVGTIPLGQKEGFSLSSLVRQRQELNARVDLARLAYMLRATLGLKKNTRVDSGQVQVALSSRPGKDGAAWHGQLDATALAATADGQQISWPQPITAVLDAHDTPQGPVVDNLRCQSDFLDVRGAGTPDDFTATLGLNLNQLADRLRQFLSLDGVQLAGRGGGNIRWKRVQQQFDAGAQFRLDGFQWTLKDKPAWREDSIAASLTAAGQTDLGDKTRIDAAALTVITPTDQLGANLTAPVTDLKTSPWNIHVDARGGLQNWPGRLAVWLPANTLRRFEGAYNVQIDGVASTDGVTLRQLKATATPLVIDAACVTINEPQAAVGVAGSWDKKSSTLRLDPAVVSTATLAVAANDVVVAMPPDGPTQVAGTLKYQGDLARLKQWLSDPKTASPCRVAGQLSGTAQLRPAAGLLQGEATARVVNLAVIDAAGQQFQEPAVSLKAAGQYDSKSQSLALERLELVSSAVAAAAAGRAAPVSGHHEAKVTGQVRYDLERVCGLLRPYIGTTVRLTGQGSSDVWYQGPLAGAEALAAGQAQAGLRWDQADVGGVLLGRGELKATMQNGAVQVTPLDLSVNQGRVHLAPRLRLTPELDVALPAGPLAERIEISPAMCASMLKYAAPALANVSSARGTFSVVLDTCRIPLSDPKKCDASGRLHIHTIEVASGPLLKELTVLLGRDAPARLRQESVVAFRVQNGRVYHEGMELQFPDLTVRTSGWVGFDKSLDIVAEMPVPPKWLVGNTTVTQAMRNQVIRLPIKNTIDKPQLDQREMQRISQQFIHQAAGNLINEGGNRLLNGIDGLLKPRK
ncbi:MAG: hypothetical protein LLG00_12530 [Planctomycetaceae bacterium]|nr:hypothetical protein [Planctomycetaceae bacterium]